MVNATNFVRILNLFSGAIGKRINTNKSGIIFSKDTPSKNEICTCMNINEWDDLGKYL